MKGEKMRPADYKNLVEHFERMLDQEERKQNAVTTAILPKPKLTPDERKLLAKKVYANPYKIGDILHHSWGYDQTNCDYYQVVEVKAHSVRLKAIASKTVPGSEGFMCDSRMPDKDHFVEHRFQALNDKVGRMPPEGMIKQVKCYVEEWGEVRYYLPTPYGWCDLWLGKPESCSWYA